MAMIQVTASELNGKKDELSSLNKTLKSSIEEVTELVNSLKSDWEGEAADAYQTSTKKVAEKLMHATEGIESYITALGRIVEAYKQTESRNTSIARG